MPTAIHAVDGIVENRKAAPWEPYNDGIGDGGLSSPLAIVIRLPAALAVPVTAFWLKTKQGLQHLRGRSS